MCIIKLGLHLELHQLTAFQLKKAQERDFSNIAKFKSQHCCPAACVAAEKQKMVLVSWGVIAVEDIWV